MDAADDAFVPLRDWLARAALPAACDEPLPPVPLTPPSAAPVVPDLAALVRDVRLFRARLADALDAARDMLLRELASAVLGRELVLAPADVAALVTRLVAAHAPALAVRVAPGDVDALRIDVPVRADPQLAPGDLVLELDAGACDLRLGARLSDVLAAWS